MKGGSGRQRPQLTSTKISHGSWTTERCLRLALLARSFLAAGAFVTTALLRDGALPALAGAGLASGAGPGAGVGAWAGSGPGTRAMAVTGAGAGEAGAEAGVSSGAGTGGDTGAGVDPPPVALAFAAILVDRRAIMKFEGKESLGCVVVSS